jgi:hypothetical protein
MKNQLPNLRPIRRAKLAYVLCVALLSAGCGQSAQINEAARREAEATANDATASYKKAQDIVSLGNKYSWEMAVDVNDQQTRNAKFTSAAKELEAARDKFSQASVKMREALNGQKAFDNELATRLSRMSDAYKRWSELAEFERKAWQEASAMTDPKAIREKLTEAQKQQQKMNEELMSMMRGIG